jgi:hypothetical protein
MKAAEMGNLRGALSATAVAFVFAALGYLMLRGQDPMQALLFEENYQVSIGLVMLISCRLFLLFISPGWLLYELLKSVLNRTTQ